MTADKVKFDALEKLPSLQKGWVRLVHRCISKDGFIDDIKQRGLVFNRQAAAEISPFQRGGSYNSPSLMASVYDEETFWQSMKKDDFGCYDNAKYADAKLVFDMPIDEFCFLEACGRIAVGKIDAKYFVGCIENVNGTNKNLMLPAKEVAAAESLSKKNPPSSVMPNNVEDMINLMLGKCRATDKEEIKKSVLKRMKRVRDDLLFELDEIKTKNKITISPKQIGGYGD